MNKFLAIALIVSAVLLLGLMCIRQFVKQNLAHTFKRNSVKNKFFLQEVKFLEGKKYSLIVHHKDHGLFLVKGRKVLEAKSDELKIKVNNLNFLNVGKNKDYGVGLYENNKLIKSRYASVFDEFEIGSLVESKRDLKYKKNSGNFDKVKKLYESLKQDSKVYLAGDPFKNRKDDLEFYFFIKLPTFLSQDLLSEDEFCKEKEELFKAELNFSRAFSIDCYLKKNNKAKLFKSSKEWSDPLLNKNKEYLFVESPFLYDWNIKISGKGKDCEEARKYNFKKLIHKTNFSENKFIEVLETLIKDSNMPELSVTKGEVGVEGYQPDRLEVGKVIEKEYSFSYYVED